MVWPAVTGPVAAGALALQYQLERSQWLPPRDLGELQLRQLDAVARHAWLTVPFYRWHWHGDYAAGESLTRATFERLPLTPRQSLHYDHEELRSSASPPAHGAISERALAGSEGMLETELAGRWRQALELRDHLWHRRDFDGTLAEIGTEVEEGEARGWGAATGMIAAAGRSVFLGATAGLDLQLEWLQRHEPEYLLTAPSNAAALAQGSIARGIRLPKLREVRSSGAPVDADTREHCRRAWNVPVTGTYASGEAGCLALQCPDHEHYHVQSESVLVEVLDERDRACPPGSMGRIVITTLQNFAMPLVRFESGDLAEVGAACPCGRGLPVLRRIVQHGRRD